MRGFTQRIQHDMLKRPAEVSHHLSRPNRNGSREDHVMAKRQLPSPEVLRQLLDYNPETGELRWKERGVEWFPSLRAQRCWNARYAGREAGSDNGKGYICFNLAGHSIKAHRAGWAIHHGEWPKHDIDHINHNKADNRMSNMRDVKRVVNNRNRPPQRNNTSRFVGVYWNKECRKWAACIGVNRRAIHLGVHDCLGRALRARREAERRFGFANGHGGAA